jgi:hypothetical protein
MEEGNVAQPRDTQLRPQRKDHVMSDWFWPIIGFLTGVLLVLLLQGCVCYG